MDLQVGPSRYDYRRKASKCDPGSRPRPKAARPERQPPRAKASDVLGAGLGDVLDLEVARLLDGF